MQNYEYNPAAPVQEISIGKIEVRPLMRLVYMWMGLGLLVTAFVALGIASSEQLVMTASNLFLPVMIAQFALVIGLSWAIQRIPANVALVLFFVYAASMGVTLSLIVFGLIASGQTMALANAFFTTAGLFGVMTVIGFTTKVDLTRFGSFLMMGLIGLVIASVVNIFLSSGALSWIISIIGVLVFTGLTAYDTQRIKEMASLPEYQQHSDSMLKMSIMGALTLYLDFINLFIFLLSLFSGRD